MALGFGSGLYLKGHFLGVSSGVSDQGGGCGRGVVMVEYITPRILPNGLIFEILHLESKIFNSGF